MNYKTHPKEYASWNSMKARCLNANNPSYYNYGGRGITVCESWLSFKNFIEDIGPLVNQSDTLDRLDSEGDHEPSNCRWASRQQQALTRRGYGIKLTLGDKTMYIKDWAKELNITEGLIRCRLGRGWPAEEALNPTLRRQP